MKNNLLEQFSDMAERLQAREKIPVIIIFKNNQGKEETISAKFDPLFATVELPSGTFPAGELKMSLQLLYGAHPETTVAVGERR
jgi:hypothetical protein